jgi:hypothetical protein
MLENIWYSDSEPPKSPTFIALCFWLVEANSTSKPNNSQNINPPFTSSHMPGKNRLVVNPWAANAPNPNTGHHRGNFWSHPWESNELTRK